MKIAHIVDSMQVGGAETIVWQMCRRQRELGHDPSVYAVTRLGDLGEQLRTEGFLVEPLMLDNLVQGSRRYFQIFRELRPDVVHMHNPTPTIFAAPAARIANVSSIVSTRHSLVAPPRQKVMEIKYGAAAACCDWIVGICDATTANIKEAHPHVARKTVRVYNGALPLVCAPVEHQPLKSGFTLVFVGRLEPVKNHELLLRAIHAALPSMPELRLWMVGDGNERAKLEQISTDLGISSQVKFWGQQLDVAPFLSAADCFIMSSVSEGLPMSLLQAFSLGLPAIVTEVGGMAEVVHIANAGFAVPLNNPVNMAQAIQHLASDSRQRESFSQNACAAYQTRFTLEIMVDAYMDLYRNTQRARSSAGNDRRH